jgi:uncharacterized protein YbaR (Trm112 family)
MIDAELLKILVCPGCKGSLEHDAEKEKLSCAKCRLRYPIDGDVPIMLVEEAEQY